MGDRSPRWRAESRRLIPTGRGPDRAGAPGRHPRLTTSTYLSPILLRVEVRRMGERYVHVGKVRSRSGALHSGTRTSCLDVRPPATCTEAARHLRLALHLHAITCASPSACTRSTPASARRRRASCSSRAHPKTLPTVRRRIPRPCTVLRAAGLWTGRSSRPQRRSDSAAPQRRRRSRGRDTGDLISSVCRARTNLGADTDHRPDHRKAPG